jgi:O-antigen/teichoic acid export membrane protein
MPWRLALTRQRRQQLWYVPVLGVAMVLMLARLLFVARLLDVTGFGVFSAGLLVSSTFGMFACFGLQPMLLRDLSIQVVRRHVRPGIVLMAQCIVVALACLLLCVAAAAAGVTATELSSPMFMAAVLHGFAQQVFLVATIESRSRGMPVRYALQNLVRSLSVVGAGAIAAFGSNSALWTLVTEAVVTLVLAQATMHRVFGTSRIRPCVAYGLALRRLPAVNWSSAVALMNVTIVSFVLINADRWLAAEALASADFAQYGFAWIVLMVAQSGQAVINAAVFPMLARRFGLHGRRAAFALAAGTSAATLAFATVAAVPLWLLLDASVRRWYPQYSAAAELLPVMLVIAALRVSDFWTSFLVVVGLETRLLGRTLAAGAITTVAWCIAVRPWLDSPVGLTDIAGLALALALVTTLTAAATSWRAAVKDDRS